MLPRLPDGLPTLGFMICLAPATWACTKSDILAKLGLFKSNCGNRPPLLPQTLLRNHGLKTSNVKKSLSQNREFTAPVSYTHLTLPTICSV